MRVLVSKIPAHKRLTCIIPMRLSTEREDAIERLEFIRLDTDVPPEVGFLVIDDGSLQEQAEPIRKKCAELQIGYIRIESSLREFSVGRCRNYGAMYATSTYVFMQDVDLMPYPGFYRALLDEVDIQGLDQDVKKFLMVPYVFLTQEGTRAFHITEPSKRARKFLHMAWLNDKDTIEKVSSGTSANLYNRHWYLTRGGNSRDFEGWGYEDLECNTRMIRHLNFFPTPKDWQTQKYNFSSILEYATWKAPYRLFGDMLLYKGVVLFHAWHPVSKGGTYMERGDYNRRLFERKMKEFVDSRSEPDALPDMSRGRTLLLRRNAFTFARDVQPLLGTVIDPDSQLLSGERDLASFVLEHQIERVVFHNPYLDDRMLELYHEARTAGIPYIICERGALPNSCFFDPTGFLVDGDMYTWAKWGGSITEDERARTISYIRSLQNSDDALEAQAQRRGGDWARRKLGIRKGEKILFVPFQRPGDTVTRFFVGALGGYTEFVDLVRDVSRSIPPSWRIVVKRHPLEELDFDLDERCVYANDVHIKDLLDISAAVLTFNSGVGVLAMAWGLPTMLAGKAFYQHDTLNAVVSSREAVIQFLRAPKVPEQEDVLRFYNHLLTKIYSFGSFATKAVKLPDGSNMTATTDIAFTQLRWPGSAPIEFSDNKTAAISWNSFLFDRYRYAAAASSAGTVLREGAASSQSGKESVVASAPLQTGRAKKKWNKLLNNPRAFFADSRFKPLKSLAHVF
ncbi:capsular polysaccharide export protein, LipB/KpsS family [Ramlibacter sp.]|uniref:capsular polysaccharide export protein, LipB/KpsS family n=1 Tax=Ramlibacter sp. TaxID=1917967 RepID=UPI002FC7A45B